MPTLLVVDDHDSVLRTLAFVFASKGLRVVTATSGAAALELNRTETFHAALVDLHMPGMDGIALCVALRAAASAAGHDLPVWVMTAAPTKVAAEHAHAGGAMAVLKKPFDCEEFAKTVVARFASPGANSALACGPAPPQ